MPTPKRHIAPGQMQFLTSSSYRRAKLSESDWFRLISVLSRGRGAALCATLRFSRFIHGKPGQLQRWVPQTHRGGSAIDGGCLTPRYNVPLRPQRHRYGLDHPYYLMTTSYCRAPVFDPEPFNPHCLETHPQSPFSVHGKFA
jgi:hypothetical protein